jgi:hypothetical protein
MLGKYLYSSHHSHGGLWIIRSAFQNNNLYPVTVVASWKAFYLSCYRRSGGNNLRKNFVNREPAYHTRIQANVLVCGDALVDVMQTIIKYWLKIVELPVNEG